MSQAVRGYSQNAKEGNIGRVSDFSLPALPMRPIRCSHLIGRGVSWLADYQYKGKVTPHAVHDGLLYHIVLGPNLTALKSQFLPRNERVPDSPKSLVYCEKSKETS